MAEDAHEKTLTCVEVTQPDGEQREVCPGLGPAEEQARANLENANANLAAAEAQLADLLSPARPAETQVADAAIAAAEAQISSAEANVAVAAFRNPRRCTRTYCPAQIVTQSVRRLRPVPRETKTAWETAESSVAGLSDV